MRNGVVRVPLSLMSSRRYPDHCGVQASVLATETLKPRKKLPPLLVALPDRKPEKLHWMGTSFGVTLELFNFWQRCVPHPPSTYAQAHTHPCLCSRKPSYSHTLLPIFH